MSLKSICVKDNFSITCSGESNVSKVIECSSNVFIGNKGVFREGDHCTPDPDSRVGEATTQSVYVNSKLIMRIGDPIIGSPIRSSCTGTMIESNNKGVACGY